MSRSKAQITAIKLLDKGLPQTEEEARALANQSSEILIFVLLEMSARIHALDNKTNPSFSTPSGMIPPYQKESPPQREKKNNKQGGSKKGHQGFRRPRPEPH